MLVKLRAKRPADFAPLTRVTNFADGRDLPTEPHTKEKIANGVSTVSGNSTPRRQPDFNTTPDAFAHAVRALMMGYALASAGEPAENTWCDLEAANIHDSRAVKLAQLDRKSNHVTHSRLTDSELQIGAEWARIAKNSPRNFPWAQSYR